MSMYAYWLANTGLTVHKLTGLMTEGIGAEELYALQESQMKKIRVLDEKDVEKSHNPDGTGMYRSTGENCRGKESVLSAWKKHGIRKSSAGFLQHLMRCIILAGCRKKHERVWQLSGRGQEVPMEARLRGNWRGYLRRTGWISSAAWRWGLMLMRIAEHWKKTGIPMRYWAVAWMCVIRKETGIYMKNAGSGRYFVGISAGHTAAAGLFSAKKPYHSRTCRLRDCDGGKKKSGSLITADYAMEQGKEVYALPGRVTDALSEGTNHLIQQGAGIFVSVEDFLQELQLQPQNITTQIDFRKNLLEKDESLVYALLDFYPVGLGTLIEKVPMVW